MHKVAPQIEAAINIPILHLANATAVCIQQHELAIIVPPAADRARV